MTNAIETITRRHAWDLVRNLPAHESPDGCDRTEKTYSHPNCGLVKITVHPPSGYPYLKWRLANGNEFRVGRTPPCGITADEVGT